MKYREIKGVKYQVMEDCIIVLPYNFKVSATVPFADLMGDRIYFHKGYVWDGPSGPTIDTKDSLEPSACHDVLCEMIMLKFLPIEEKNNVDWCFATLCKQEGMNPIRATIWQKGVNIFGKLWMRFSKEPKIKEV